MNLPLILRYALRLGAALTLSVSLAACGATRTTTRPIRATRP